MATKQLAGRCVVPGASQPRTDGAHPAPSADTEPASPDPASTDSLALPAGSAGGQPVTLSNIRAPLFVVATTRDHVAPWRSVYKINLVAEQEVTFLLTSGGHNAGIVSEPGHPHRSYQLATRPAGAPYAGPGQWAAQAPRREGSWWPAWQAWLAERSARRAARPAMGAPGDGYPPLGDAPGTYVLQR